VKSRTDPDFWRLFKRLPKNVQRRAKVTYRLWKADPHHRGLNFKRIGKNNPIYAVRIGLRWRALGLKEDGAVT
jgi:hypothetical protein